ncbi:DUF106 domain-containing protein [Candidatus Bathyarchaeota archaeon]|nr:DUF106 domain-containing protein [Candidatus Bathyarchaeota archaeon]
MLTEFLKIIPYSTIFITLLAFLVSLITTLLNRKFIDRRLLAKWQKEIQEWNAEKELAKKTGDKKLLAKVRKREIQIMQIRAKMSKQQTKVMVVTFIPLLLMWWVLTSFYGFTPVAYMPLLGEPIEINFVYWYLICSFFFNFLLSRIFNVEMGFGTRT